MFARRRNAGEGPAMHSVETPFDRDEVWSEAQVPDRMNITREPCDKRPDKVVANGRLSFQDSRGKMDYDVIRVIG